MTLAARPAIAVPHSHKRVLRRRHLVYQGSGHRECIYGVKASQAGERFAQQTGRNRIWKVLVSAQGALIRLYRNVRIILVLAAVACIVPFRAAAESPPDTGSTIHGAVHVAPSAVGAGYQSVPSNIQPPAVESIVDTSSQLRGVDVANSQVKELYSAAKIPSQRVDKAVTGSNGSSSGWNIFGAPHPVTKLTWFDEATYYFHKALTSGTLLKSVALLFLCMPIVAFLGPLYGKASDRSVTRGMYLTFCTLMRVPSPVYKEKKLGAAVVLNVVFMCGLFVFAVFLGLITEDVKQQVALIKEGVTPVACKQHTVVCYWNESTPALLRQICKARKGRDAFGGTVVVVADRDKFSMDQEVEQEVFLKTNERFDVETRRGSPMDVSDLQRAGVGWASTVFVMLPGQDMTVSPRGRVVPQVATLVQRNALKVSTALRVQSLRDPPSVQKADRAAGREQRLVLQDSTVTEIGYADKFLSGYSAGEEVSQERLSPACQPLGESVMTSLAAQCACRPGLARVVDYLFTHDPNREQMRYMDVTDDDGVQTYGGFRRKLCGASAMGFWSAAENRTLLNPKDSACVSPGDQMLVLSKRQPKFAPEAVISDDIISHAQQWMSGQHNVNPKDKPKRVIVLNWRQDLDALLQHFSDFSPAGSEIVFVHQEKKGFIPSRIGSVRFRQVVSKRDLDKDALMKAGFHNCDAIVYGPNMSVSNYVYDSQLISDIMVLQSWYNEEQSSARLHILAPARDPFTAHTVHHVLKDFGDAQLRLQKVDPETRISEICSLQKRSIGDSTAQPDTAREQAGNTAYVEQMKPSSRVASDGEKKQELPLQHVVSAELYMPREFATAMMVHVSMQPKLMNILQELFDSQSGHSIWLRPAQYLHINSANDPDPVSFAWISEAARARGETALGIITREGEVQLAPPVKQLYKFRPGDRIVVIQHQPPKNIRQGERQGGFFKRKFRHKPVL